MKNFTKAKNIVDTLPIEEIKVYVDEFIDFAKRNPLLMFLVTEIGCGLANLKQEQVAPLFKQAVELENVWLPKSFWNVLSDENNL